MKLLTYKGKDFEYTYYINPTGTKVEHGEYKEYYSNGRLWEHSFRYHGEWHGEHKSWDYLGSLNGRCFYINGVPRTYVEMNDQEKLLFQIKHPGFKFLDDV